MALMNFTGFETGSLLECQVSTGVTISVQSAKTAGAWSNYALRTNPSTPTGMVHASIYGFGTNGLQSTTAGGVTARPYVRFRFCCDLLPASNSEEFFATVGAAGGALAQWRINADGTISVYSLTTHIYTGTKVLSAGVWYLIEITHGKGAAQLVEWKVDGVVDASQNVASFTQDCYGIRLGKGNNRNNQLVDYYYDDVALSNSEYPGNGRSVMLLPNAAGSTSTWSIGAGSGANWEQVDEVPNDVDTTYLLSPLATGQVELFGLQPASVPGISGEVKGVKAAEFLKGHAGTSNVFVRLRSGATDSDNTAATAPTSASYLLASRLLSVDPATAAPWTVSALDTVEIGARHNSASQQTRCTAAYLCVDFIPAVAGTYTATAALTVGAATLTGSATFAPLAGSTRTATAALTSSKATLAGAATRTVPLRTATGVLVTSKATLVATATFRPKRTATAALTSSKATLAGAATRTVPIYTGTAVLVAPKATLIGAATFTPPAGIFTGTAVLVAAKATLAGIATRTLPPPRTATGTLTASRATLAGVATRTVSGRIATAVLTAPKTMLAGTAKFILPRVATAALTAPRAVLAGLAQHVKPVDTGTAVLVTSRAVLAGMAQHVRPVYQATATLTSGRAVLVGQAFFVTPVYEAEADLVVKAATLTGVIIARPPAVKGPFYFDEMALYAALVIGDLAAAGVIEAQLASVIMTGGMYSAGAGEGQTSGPDTVGDLGTP